MIKISDKETGAAIGTITEQQLQFLIDQLEEESLTDQDYYINKLTLDMFEERDADAQLVAMLRTALGDRVDMEIVWSR